MPRATHNVPSHRRRRKLINKTKGYRGAKSKLFRTAKEALEKSLQYAYRDRRQKKRDFRRLWITRINAAARLYGLTYSKLMDALNKKNIIINRKVLANLAITDPTAFKLIIDQAVS